MNNVIFKAMSLPTPVESWIHKNIDSSFFDKEVIIDCGHTPVLANAATEEIFFGRLKTPSNTEISTLEIGIELLRVLESLNKKAKISLCLSDTTRHISSVENRNFLKGVIDKFTLSEYAPDIYRKILYKKIDSVVVTLQSQNSNRFTLLMKSIKQSLKKHESQRQLNNLYSKTYNTLFLNDLGDNVFCFTNPFLLDYSHEIELMNGDWWLNDFIQLNSNDMIRAPLLRIKKLGIVKVYDKTKGILCAGTYCGLLKAFDNVNHISIYSRYDDEFIAEKIFRGYLSAFAFINNFDRQCTQFTFTEDGNDLEVANLCPENLIYDDYSSMDIFLNSFKTSKLGANYVPCKEYRL